MRQSILFTKTRKEAPSDEVSENAKLLIKGGFIHKEMSGVYSYLPLGLRVLKKIENIIREEINLIGGQEVLLSSLQEKDTWEPTDQWSDENVDIWFKTKLKNNTELGLAVTHEAPMTKMLKEFLFSFRDFPKLVYQFQTKFRNEIRAKSGIMRTREFVMKDLYSFCINDEEHEEVYNKVKDSYIKIFNRLGIGEKTFVAFASGGMFSQFSHEFQTLTESGEDIIYIDEEKKIAVNKEVYNDQTLKDLGLSKDKLIEKKSVEVGNIFSLGTRFSDALNLSFADVDGIQQKVVMGSYGIGPGRVMGTIAEILSDDRGIVWPSSIAPFQVHLIALTQGDDEISLQALEIYNQLIDEGVEVLYDDRDDIRPGEKFADSDLLGIPYRLVLSTKSLSAGGIEVKKRNEKDSSIVKIESLVSFLKEANK